MFGSTMPFCPGKGENNAGSGGSVEPVAGFRVRSQNPLICRAFPRPECENKSENSRRYWISVSSLNIGRYIAMMMIPTTMPTAIIISGSMIDVRLAIALSTSSS